MANECLDKSGLTYFWGKIKTKFILTSAKGAASGVCPLDSNSKIDGAYLPGYYDSPSVSGTNLVFPTNYLITDGNNLSYGSE